jgi:multidrug resistance protein MdtO
MYLITKEDTATTVIGSFLGIIGVTVGLSMSLLALEISMDIPWLRLCFIILYLFGGLFLKRVITIEGLGSAIGIPAAMAMMLPDIMPPDPEVTVEFILWVWCCAAIGLSVNAIVQLLLSSGDPLKLLRRELDSRILAVETALCRLAGEIAAETPVPSLNSLAIAGMSRPLELLKTASIVHRWARERHEGLSALITLTDRLVTSAIALETLKPDSDTDICRKRLLNAADCCGHMRRALQSWETPSQKEWATSASGRACHTLSPLSDIDLTLEDIGLSVKNLAEAQYRPIASAGKFRLFVPDAFDNPDYVHFAIKGSLAAFICYLALIGFDYPGIYTSVITCFVVSLSTIGAANQKGILRFGGSAVGGFMGIIALVYLFPNIDSIGGYWVVFGAGTAIAAWVTFGSPRIWYGGYQIGLAFYKAIMQRFGPAFYLKVVRDRLVGIFFGLVVFGIIEHFLWPVRASDAMRSRLAEIFRSLSELARAQTDGAAQPMSSDVLDSWRLLISEKFANIQVLIESSKFELGNSNPDEIQKLTGEAQIVFILFLELARLKQDMATTKMAPAAVELNSAIAKALQTFEAYVAEGSAPSDYNLDGVTEALQNFSQLPDLTESLPPYSALVTAITRIFIELPKLGEEGHEVAQFGVIM